MAVASIKIKVLPDSPEIDIEDLKKKITHALMKAGAIRVASIEEEEIAFGLKALIVMLAWPEEKETSEAESAIQKVDGVSQTDIIDYRRAFG